MILDDLPSLCTYKDCVNCQGLTPPKGGTSGGAEIPPFGGVNCFDATFVVWIAHFLSS